MKHRIPVAVLALVGLLALWLPTASAKENKHGAPPNRTTVSMPKHAPGGIAAKAFDTSGSFAFTCTDQPPGATVTWVNDGNPYSGWSLYAQGHETCSGQTQYIAGMSVETDLQNVTAGFGDTKTASAACCTAGPITTANVPFGMGDSMHWLWRFTATLGGGASWQSWSSDCTVSGATLTCTDVIDNVPWPLSATATPTVQATNTLVPTATATPIATNTPQATATTTTQACQLGITAIYPLGGEQALAQINTSPAADDYTVYISWQPATMFGPARFPGVGNGEFLTVDVGATGAFTFAIEGQDTTSGVTCSGSTYGPAQII